HRPATATATAASRRVAPTSASPASTTRAARAFTTATPPATAGRTNQATPATGTARTAGTVATRGMATATAATPPRPHPPRPPAAPAPDDAAPAHACRERGARCADASCQLNTGLNAPRCAGSAAASESPAVGSATRRLQAPGDQALRQGDQAHAEARQAQDGDQAQEGDQARAKGDQT